ncbi:MAG: hypothetical protein ACRDYD_11025, partial [Acidimicrobiales bacterium]
MKLGLVSLLAAAGVGLVTAGPALVGPSTYTCSGTPATPGVIPAGSWSAVAMPAGTACTMPGPGEVRVLSSLRLGAHSALLVSGGSLRVNGSVVVGPGAVMAELANSVPVRVNGSVTVRSDG